jgi:hypothetical protein
MKLVIVSDPLSKILIDFEYKDGKTIANYISPNLINDATRWLERGLHEWIDDETDHLGKGIFGKRPRSTLSTEPEFLFRLKQYLQRQFGFTYYLGEKFMVELERKFGDRDWFHSVGTDQYGRTVVYVKYMCHETLHDIPDTVDGKQVLVHFAGYLLATREVYTNPNARKQEDADVLTSSVKILIGDLGKQKVRDIFYEIHDGPNALTQLSDTHPYARDCLDKLYEEYGFDVLFDLLDNE